MGDPGPDRRGQAAPGREDQMHDPLHAAPCGKDMHKLPLRQRGIADMVGKQGDPQALDRCLPHRQHVFATQPERKADGMRTPVVGFQMPFAFIAGVARTQAGQIGQSGNIGKAARPLRAAHQNARRFPQ